MSDTKLNILLRYGAAIAFAMVALVLAVTLEHPWVTLSPFFLFYAAVAVSSWYGGTGPGVVVTVIGALAVNYYLLEPAGSMRIEHPRDVARLVLFTLVGVLIASLNGALRRAQFRCQLEAQAARGSEARAKRLAEANLIGVYFSDLSGNIRWANNEFLRLVGKTPDDLSTSRVNWRDVTAPEHRDRDDHALRELRETRVCTPFEKDHILADGQRVPVLCGFAALSDVDDVVGFVLDLTDRKKAEARAKRNEEQLREVSAELMLAEERERRRIATVLHDAVGQILALAKLKVDVLRRTQGNGDSEKISEVYQLIDDAITQTRTLTADISPPVLYELGLAAAIQWLGDRLRSEHGIAFDLAGDRQKTPLTEEARIVIFQAVRELMMNIVKHARASTCWVRIARDDAVIRVVVEDDGEGFVAPAQHDYSKGGFGLFNIRQRLDHLGGDLVIAPRSGRGTVVTITAPLAQTSPQEVIREHHHSIS